jgi:hypothetical protein
MLAVREWRDNPASFC